MDTNENGYTYRPIYPNADAKFHRNPCAKLYLHVNGHCCGNADCNGNPHTDPHAH